MKIFKIILVGNSGVGKSSLLRRYIYNDFIETYNSTIGIDFKHKIINNDTKLHIWDTAGQERFCSIIKTYYRNIDCVFLFFDITNKASFLALQYWYDEVKKYSDPLFILIGTKNDLKQFRKVNLQEISDFIIPKHMKYFEISSKTGENISDIFDVSIDILLKKYETKILTTNYGYLNFNNYFDKKKYSYC